MPTTVPSRAMKSRASGMSVFFIQKLWLPSASKTKSMPRPSASDLRYMSPRSRSAGVAATSSETSTAAPGPRITATGPRSRQPARASAAATAARMTRCCMGESRGLSGEHADRHPVHRVPAGRGGALHLPGLGPVQPAARGHRKVHCRSYRGAAVGRGHHRARAEEVHPPRGVVGARDARRLAPFLRLLGLHGARPADRHHVRARLQRAFLRAAHEPVAARRALYVRARLLRGDRAGVRARPHGALGDHAPDASHGLRAGREPPARPPPLGGVSHPELHRHHRELGAGLRRQPARARCGRCSSQCPATATGKPLAPRQLLLDLRDYLYAHQDEVIAKRVRQRADGDGAEPPEVGENIVGPVIADEVLWSCNVCRACEEACPVMIEYVDKIVDMRRHLVQEATRFPNELTRTFKGMETQSNPWGLGAEKRFDWAQGLGVPTIADKPNAEYLYYVGCAGAFDDRNKKTTQAFARLLEKSGVDFACLAKEELCNGETARRLGNEYLYQTMAQACIESFDTAGVKKIIVNCPHCFNTIKNEFPQFGGRYQVIHAAELVAQLIAQGRLQVPPEFRKKTVYHDSCYYGRFNEIYDEPRTVLARTGAEVQEMRRHKQFGMCCGAGGGRMWIEEDPNKRVNLLRTAQALETNPEVIAVSCPFCMTMLSDGIKAKELEDKVQTLDVMEIVAKVAT